MMPMPTLKILLIEDNPGDARLIREMLLEARSIKFDLKIVDRLAPGLDYLGREAVDVLLADLSLPDSFGLETLITIHRKFPAVPIVVLTGLDDERQGLTAVQAGAQDYLVKGQVESQLLVRAVRYAIERKRIAAELTLEQARLRAILDSMGEGVIYHEAFESKYINQALSDMTGYAPDEYSGYLDLLRSERETPRDMGVLYEQIEDAIEHAGIWRGEKRLRRKDGSEFDAGLTCTPVVSPDEHILGAVTIIRDISQEKDLQAQKSRFVANASHELRTPLTNMKTTVYLMRRQPEKTPEHLDTLEFVVDRMRGLVEDLLDVTRFERGKLNLHQEYVTFQDLIKEVVQLQRAEAGKKHITLSNDLCSDPLTICADKRRIVQVITNLVINAVNYTPEHGNILVQLSSDPAGYAVVRVQDSGIGIPPEALSKIFSPFFRVNEGGVVGTGLGLTITKEIVELHGGNIEVESEFGKGAAFIVRLQLATVEA